MASLNAAATSAIKTGSTAASLYGTGIPGLQRDPGVKQKLAASLVSSSTATTAGPEARFHSAIQNPEAKWPLTSSEGRQDFPLFLSVLNRYMVSI
jgi:hypothetical protein